MVQPQPHPHHGATYKLIARKDGAFEVEVSIPGTSPTTITNLPKRTDAEHWIERHKAVVDAGRPRRPSFRMPAKQTR
jgi:hypothetical protein